MMSYTIPITVIRGDGIGPEVIEATIRVLGATGVSFKWEYALAGLEALEQSGTELPQETVEAMKRTGITLKGPIGTPIGEGYRSVNVRIREALQTFANIRPVKKLPGVRSRFGGVDIVVIRENSEGFYAGFEASALDYPFGYKLCRLLEEEFNRKFLGTAAFSIGVTSYTATERIVRYAFKYAREKNRKRVTCVHKANILKATDGLFLEVFERVAKDYPDIESNDIIVDNAAGQLVRWPKQFDVLLCPNLYGDILSDLCAGLVGGLGVAPSANIGDQYAVFEAVHGTAPDIRGKGIANPTALMLSGAMMLEWLGKEGAAKKLRIAVCDVLREGTHVTPDINPASSAGTQGMADAVCTKLKRKI